MPSFAALRTALAKMCHTIGIRAMVGNGRYHAIRDLTSKTTCSADIVATVASRGIVCQEDSAVCCPRFQRRRYVEG